MAYLKGGTVVDGTLYVEGTILAKAVSTGDNNTQYTYIPTTQAEKVNLDKILILAADEGKLRESNFSEPVTVEDIVSLVGAKPFSIRIGGSSEVLTVSSAGVVLDTYNSLTPYADDQTSIGDGDYRRPAYWA